MIVKRVRKQIYVPMIMVEIVYVIQDTLTYLVSPSVRVVTTPV